MTGAAGYRRTVGRRRAELTVSCDHCAAAALRIESTNDALS